MEFSWEEAAAEEESHKPIPIILLLLHYGGVGTDSAGGGWCPLQMTLIALSGRRSDTLNTY